MSDTNNLRFYIDRAIMTRDYAALAGFEGRLDTLQESREDESPAVEAARAPGEGSPGRLEPERATWFGLFGAQARVNP